MGCSPSHAVIINSSPSQETICLQPRIYMVSESTLCLLRDVGELRVYNVDDRDPSPAVEKFQGAQDQLQNPLLFQPQLRRRQRMNADELQSLAGTSNVGKEIQTEETNDDTVESLERDASEEQLDDIDHGSHPNTRINTRDDLASESARSPNSHSVSVEVYSYKINADDEDGEPAAQEANETKTFDDLESEEVHEYTGAAVVVPSAFDKNQASDENSGSAIRDLATMDTARQVTAAACSVETNELIESSTQSSLPFRMRQKKAAVNEGILELDGCNA